MQLPSPRLFSVRNIALFYFGAPLILFLFFWFSAPFNFIFIALFLFAVIKIFQGEWQHSCLPDAPAYSFQKMMAIVYIAVFATAAAGVGAFILQSADYNKHNFIIDSFTHLPWPANFKTADGFTAHIVYYLGYPLVPGFLTRGASMLTTDFVSFIWAAIGLCVGLVLFLRFFKLPFWSLLPLMLFGGLSFLGNFFLRECRYDITAAQYSHWALPLRCVPLFTAFGWSAPYLIAPLALVPLTLAALQKKKTTQAILWASLGALWNPFVCVGLAPFIAWDLLKEKLRAVFRLETLAIALSALFPVAVYYSSKIFPEQFLFIGANPEFLKNILPFFICEFGLWFLLLDSKDWKSSHLWLTLVLIIFTSVFSMGASFDWCYRVLMVAQIILAGHIFSSVLERPTFLKTFLLPIMLGISVLGALSEFAMTPGIPYPYASRVVFRVESRNFFDSLGWLSRQYIGTRDKNFLTKLLLAKSTSSKKIEENWSELQIERQFVDVDASYPSLAHDEKPHFWLISPARLVLKNNGLPRRISVCLCLSPTGKAPLLIGISKGTPNRFESMQRMSAFENFQRGELPLSREWAPRAIIHKKPLCTFMLTESGIKLQLELFLATGETEIDLFDVDKMAADEKLQREMVAEKVKEKVKTESAKNNKSKPPADHIEVNLPAWFMQATELHLRPASFNDPAFLVERLD